MGKSISKNAMFNMLNKGIAVAFPLITVSYISRVLGASGIGEVSSAQNLSTYFSMGAALGIPSYGVRAVAQARKDRQKCGKVFSELFFLNLMSTIVALALYFVALYGMRNNYPNLTLSFVFAGSIVFNIINIEWVYQGFEEYEYITVRSLIVKILSVFLLFIFVRKETDLIAYALIICFGSVGNYILNFLNLRKYIRMQISGLNLKKHLVPVLTFFISVIAIEIYSLLDVTMLTAMTDSTCVGYYTNSTKIVKAVANTLTGVSAVLMPRFSYLFAEDDKKKIQELSGNFLNITFLISIPSCIGLILVADQLVTILFGAGFEPAIATIRILSFLIIFMPLSGGVFCQLLLTSGNEKKYLMCVLVGTIVNAALNSLFISRYAQNGAAAASVIAEMVISGMMIIASMRAVKVFMKKRDIISILCSVIMMIVVIILLKNIFFALPMWLELTTEILGAIIAYFAGIIFIKNSITQNLLKKMRLKIK